MSTTTGLPASLTFNMKYTYDWLGRMQTMTFPNWLNQSFQFIAGEGEKVSYFYDLGGNIDRITGHHQTRNPQQTSHPIDFVYVDHVGYDGDGRRRVLISGNGIANKYGYDAARRISAIAGEARGSQEVQQNRPPTPFHQLQYEYDKNGNVTRMKNEVSVQPWRNASVFIGPLDVTYTYDASNQLRTMSSKYRPNVAYGYQSADTFTYDEIGNIKTKAQTQDRLVWDNQTVNTFDLEPVATQLSGSRFDHNVAGLTYSLSYQYAGSRPHATDTIAETPAGSAVANRAYAYDANGNNTGNTFKTDGRTQVWDEENRLKQVTRNGGSLAQFRYDDQGERTKKLTAAGDAWYVNQYFVLLPNNRPTKHIFAGETRVATKTDAITMQTPVLHYYHPDHLGTTAYISDKDQNLVQHERYFAFGELWRPSGEQEETDLSRPNGDRTEWLFTGKEWDVDTGLYYFGARYFDPHTGVWQSTDPILKGYVDGLPNGGVYFPRNLGLYTYSWNNPIVVRDPDGNCPNCLVALGGAAVGAAVGGTGQMLANALRGEPLMKGVFWGPIAHGAVAGGLAGFTLGASTTVSGSMIASGLANVVGAGVGRAVDTGDTQMTTENMLRDFGIGTASYVVGYAAGELMSPAAEPMMTPLNQPTTGGLSAEQAANFARFEKRLPAGAGPSSVHDLPGGGKAFQSEVTGRVPGSKAIYEKQVGAAGETVQFTKTTVDPSGRIVHTKNKLTGDVILPP